MRQSGKSVEKPVSAVIESNGFHILSCVNATTLVYLNLISTTRLGYFALCAAINRAQQNGIDITNAQYYSKITIEELSEILRGDDSETKVPLLEERVKCLHEVGTVLLEKYDGKFESCLLEADHSARRLLRIITDEFPCYRDEAEWNGIGVSLYKRAQILIGDLVIVTCAK